MYVVKVCIAGEWSSVFWGTFSQATGYQMDLSIEQPSLMTDVVKATF